MKAVFHHIHNLLTFTDDDGNELRTIPASSVVRNELNGLRPCPGKDPNDVFYSENEDGSQGDPAQPRSFPPGSWTITGKEVTHERWLQPVKLITDATQELQVFELDEKGCYKAPTGKTVADYGYRIHFRNGSDHTDGCIGTDTQADIEWCDQNLAFPIPLEVPE